MDGKSILKSVIDTYACIQSYSDQGTVDRVPPIGTTSLEFKTSFVRPCNLYFEWRRWHPYFGKERPAEERAISHDGKYSYFISGKDQQKVENLAAAISAATGISSGSVHMILRLLIPEHVKLGRSWFTMDDIQVLGTDEVNGHTCHHLLGSCKSPKDTEAWIGTDDFFVRRIRKHMRKIDEDIESSDDYPDEQDRVIDLPSTEYYQEYNFHQIVASDRTDQCNQVEQNE